jgi:predicted metalloenzyme YecM
MKSVVIHAEGLVRVEERLPNPTLAVTDGSVTVKFHPWTIEQIVASEA